MVKWSTMQNYGRNLLLSMKGEVCLDGASRLGGDEGLGVNKRSDGALVCQESRQVHSEVKSPYREV